MGEIHKIGQDYYIEFFARGLKYQQKIGPDKNMAKSVLADIEAKIAKGEIALIVRDVDVDIFLKDFLSNSLVVYGIKSVNRVERVIDDFTGFLKKNALLRLKLSQITPKVLDQYKSHLEPMVRPKVLCFTFALLKEIFDYALKLSYLNYNPILHIRTKNAPGRLPGGRSFLHEEWEGLFQKIPVQGADLLRVVLHTGLRAHELVSLKWADINWKKKYLTVQERERSTVSRQIPLSPSVCPILERLRIEKRSGVFVFSDAQGQALSTGTLHQYLHHILKESGLDEKFNILNVRYSFARHIARQGAGLGALCRILGLQDIARAFIFSLGLGQMRPEDGEFHTL